MPKTPWEDDPVVSDTIANAPWDNDPVVEPPKDGGYDSKTWLGRRAEDVTDLATGAYEAAFPERDPRYEETPGFTGRGLPLGDVSHIQSGKLTAAGFEDKPWRQLVLETIGNERIKDFKKDKKGNEIVVYQGDDGKEYETYINEPGLDWQDVDRFVSGSVPYMVGAYLTSKIPGLRGSMLTRAPAQATTAAGVSIGQDITADQPVDLPKAGMTAVMGGAGEVAGVAAGKLWRRLMEPEYYDEAAGTLTRAGRKEAEKLGLNPDEVEGDMARRLSEIRRAEDPRAAAAGIESGEFGIPTTRGQRSADPQQLHVEEQMRRSLFGPGARDVITEFDQTQKQAIGDAAETVRQRVAPQAADTVADAGQDIGEGIRAARAASDDQVSAAWRETEDLYPVLTDTKTGNAARDLMTQTLRTKFDDLGFVPDEQLTPTAHRMMLELRDYSRNIPTDTPYEILGKTGRAPSLDAMRRRMLARYQGAQPGQDKAAARAIYSAFDDWMDGISGQQFLRNKLGQIRSPKEAQKIAEARRITREQRQLFEPKDRRGKLAPEGKILTDLADNADTPERIVQSLFGANVTSTPKAGTVGALKKLKDVFGDDLARWDQVKGAYFLKMITDKDGNLYSPGRMKTQMNKAFANQKSVIDTLFDDADKTFMRRFQKAVETAAYTPPNPSGTSYALESFRRNRRNNVLEYLLKKRGQAATFQGEPAQSTMWHVIARIVPDIFNMQDAASRSMARRAIGQTLDFKPDKGTLLSGIAAAHTASEEGSQQDQ